ncbi:GNAT family N-acetyltransferase [Paucibacter sp. APW11]|uniref:GNAT family N-acetyltransferase n=1 Tax=Roseateles aquae TaxID=3077235 RepID=A0ABU3P9Z1_9BURK|nr:GNAT family N-acetyltransferase [Paucibacter sp. APW11]MDT8999391.1 GNAT family N-acetyltransferase [Paucibacter sp. APW11]
MEILRTERLRLRWFSENDAGFMLGLLNEPGWHQNISDPGVGDVDAAAKWIGERLIDKYWEQGHGFWAVERLDDGELIGLCGIFKRPGLPHADVGYALPARHEGRGYAREAAAACLRYAHEVLGMDCVQAITAVGNERSGHLLKTIGLVDCGAHPIEGYDEPSQLYEWRSPQFDARRSDAEQIDMLISRFFACFDNRGGRIAPVATLPFWLLPQAQIHRIETGAPVDGPQTMDVRSFTEPRAALLSAGRLREFSEWETDHQTRIHGAIAQRWSRYRKQGELDGEIYRGEGMKTFQLIKTTRGWKIGALSWQDD